jgi:hypothetical protein
MQLWTYHPTGFQVDAPDLAIDPKRGQYWWHEATGFRYREVLPKLQQVVGVRQFLWCYTFRGQCLRVQEAHDVVEWELNVPDSNILGFLRSSVWEDIVWSRSNDWSGLLVAGTPEASKNIHALVFVPLPPGTARCHGLLPPQHTSEMLRYAAKVAEASRNLPKHERDVYDF